jgi:hypothetical protein
MNKKIAEELLVEVLRAGAIWKKVECAKYQTRISDCVLTIYNECLPLRNGYYRATLHSDRIGEVFDLSEAENEEGDRGFCRLLRLVYILADEQYIRRHRKVCTSLLLEMGCDSRIDKSHFYCYDPTMENAPASAWASDTEKVRHLGDTFINLDSFQRWQFTKNGDVYGWTPILDNKTTK